jgi:hypothetical protein
MLSNSNRCLNDQNNSETHNLISANKMLRQECPNGSKCTQDGKHNEEYGRDGLFPESNILPVQLQVEGDGQDDGDEGAERSAEERTHGVEGWEDDGDEQQKNNHKYSDKHSDCLGDKDR